MYLSYITRQFKLQISLKTAKIRAHRKILSIIAAAVLIPIIIFAGKGMISRSSTANKNRSPVYSWPKSAANIAEIVGIAVITSGSMYLIYRRGQKSIVKLPILTEKEDEK